MAWLPTSPRTNWYPSGAAFATRATAVMPPAPPALSTMTCCPRSSERRGARIRARTSPELPAADGTTMVTGRAGQTCALALPIAVSKASAHAMASFMVMRMSGRLETFCLHDRQRGRGGNKLNQRRAGRLLLADGRYGGGIQRIVLDCRRQRTDEVHAWLSQDFLNQIESDLD